MLNTLNHPRFRFSKSQACLLLALFGAAGASPLSANVGIDYASVADMGSAIGSTAFGTGSLILDGVHGHPLQRRAEPGRFTAWVAGDLGADNYGSRDGSLAVGEVGGGYNFGPVQLDLAIGGTSALQHTLYDGKTRFDSTYLVVDAIAPIPSTPLVATLTGFVQWGDTDTTRVSQFGGTFDTAYGSTDSLTAGGSARLDWVDALVTHGFSFTPYAKFTGLHTHVGAYTETGGFSAASFDASSDTVFEQALGVNAARPLNKNVTLTGTLEGVHRFEGHSSSVDGSFGGFLNFSQPGRSYRQNWLRAGVGADYIVGRGVLSVSLNATTEGEAATAWLATAYQFKF